jgi:glycine cleavage system H lipoate-binding protein
MIPGVDDIRVTYARECARLADEMTQILGSAIDELTPALKELGETALGKEGMTKIILDLEAISKRAASVYSSVADEVIEANGKLKKDTEDTIGRTCAVWETLKLGAQQYFESFKGLMQTWADAVSETLLNVENALSDFFFDALMGKLKSFKDYLRSFLTDMARSISRAFSASIMQTIVKLGVPSLVGAIGGLFGGAAPAGGGGALPTMDMPAPFMQKGGIVSRPQLSWIGEGGRSEAVVPLPDNRSIPVTLKGGTQAPPVNVNFYVNAIDSTTFGAWLQKHRTQVQGMILQAVGTDPNFRASFRSI